MWNNEIVGEWFFGVEETTLDSSARRGYETVLRLKDYKKVYNSTS